MEHLKNFLEGTRQVLRLDTGSHYIRPDRNGFLQDASALRGDGKRIAHDLTKVTRRYGEQAYLRKG